MKLYIYDKSSLSYKRFKFLNLKFLVYFLLIQICLSIGLIFTISSFYDTPKEKKLKEDISYLIEEFEDINRRIIESEAILQQIQEHHIVQQGIK